MSTNYIAPIWRMPRNANKDKLSNYSINMANANEKITLTDGVDLGINSTVSLWVNFSTNNNSVILADDINASSSGYFLLLNTSTGDTYVRIGPNFGVTPFNTSWNLNQWYNIIIVRQGDTVEFFKDNVSLGTRSGYGTTVTTKFDCIGAKNAGTNPMYGQISQVVGFNYALTDGTTPGTTNQIEYLYNLNNPMVPGNVNLTAPVVYYPLGDNSNPNEDTLSNETTYPNISAGADSVFDFIPNDYIDLGTNLQDILSSNQNTISFWFRSDTASDFDTLFSQGKDSSVGYRLFLSGGDLSLNRSEQNPTNDRQTITISPAPSSQTWNHLVLVTDTSATTKLTAYLNGDPVGAYATGTITYNNGGSVAWIGGQFGITQYWDGQISNLQIWNTNLSSSEAITLYNNGQPLMTGTQPQEANLQAWYKLNQSANWEADTVGNWQIPNAVSSYPQSFTFLSPTTVNSPGYYNFPGDFTVSVWAKVHNIASTYGMIFAIGNNSSPPTGPGGYFGFAASNRRLLYDDVSSGAYFTSNNVWEYNKWCHIVVVKEGTVPPKSNNLQIYINGQPDSIVATSTIGVQGQLTLGRWLGSTAYRLDGNISNFQFWDKALSASQVLTLYNDGTPLTSAIETANLQGWWKLDNTAIWDGNEWDFPDLSGNAQTLRSNAMTEQNLANDNVSVFNGESSSMNTTNLVQSNLTRTQPYSDYSIQFDAAGGDYAKTTAGSNSILSGSTSFTISAWVNFADTTSLRPIVTNWEAGTLSFNYIFRYSGGQLQLYVRASGASGSALYNWTPTLDTWYNVIGTWDGSTGAIKLYINGVDTGATGSITGTMSTITVSDNIGLYTASGTNYYMDGKLSNIAYWKNLVLSEDNILNIYNNGITQDLNNFRITPINWFPLNESYTYFNGTSLILRDAIAGRDATGFNIVQENVVGNAPGSEASGLGVNITIADLKGDMYNSDKNAYSINMGDYADGVTNPADSGRSTEIPTVP